jgi:hypothetical protein
MMLIYFTYTPYQPGDEDIIQDSTLVTGFLNLATRKLEKLLCYPNPANETLQLESDKDLGSIELLTVSLVDLSGREIFPQRVSKQGKKLQIDFKEEMSPGFYLGKINSPQGQFDFKFVKN